MSDDPELDAIRARLRAQMLEPTPEPETPEPPAATTLDHPVDLDESRLQPFVNEHSLTVIDCWAPWCGPCRIVGPIVDRLAREMSGRVAFGKLNVDENPRASQAFGIQSIPTLLVFKEGRLVDRLVGALPKAQLVSSIERHAGGGRRASTPGPRRRPE